MFQQAWLFTPIKGDKPKFALNGFLSVWKSSRDQSAFDFRNGGKP
jgi:hypothetical protein